MNLNVPPETWYAIGSVALTLLVSAAHRRGHRLPLLELLLDAVQGSPKRAETSNEQLMDEIKRRLPLADEKK